MKTPKESMACNPLNALTPNRKHSTDAQNRIRVPKKRLMNQINQNSSNETTNNENLDNNVIVINPSVRPSIGKWMYESDEFLTEMALDLTTSPKEDNNKNNNTTPNETANDNSNDGIEVIGAYSAGPSGVTQNVVNQLPNNVDENDLTIFLDCDMNPNLLTNGLNISLLDTNVDNLDAIPSSEDDVITIDDSIEESPKQSSSANENDLEIIRVKLINPPQTDIDSEIEMLSESLTPSEVIDMMRNYLVEVQSTTLLSFTTLRLLMTELNWNRQLFLSQYFEEYNGNANAMLKKYQISITPELMINSKRRRLRQKTSSRSKEVDKSEELKTCLVCYDEASSSEMFGASCGHLFCVECWNHYISTHVNDQSKDEKICCQGENCSNIIQDDDLLAIIREQSVADRYRRLISNSFVKNNRKLRWCPNGDCLHAIRVKSEGPQDIECVCRTVFCFVCGDTWHEPLTCAQHHNWVQKYTQETIDKNSATWLTKNTKCCPKCQFPIEKNGGCNYVMCAKCKYSFCYVCLGKCSHGRCLGQNASDALQAQAMDQWVKNDLQIYPTIKDQYKNQLKKYTVENRLQKNVSNKLEKEVKCKEFRSALKFIKSAFTVLCHCRQTLIYSYVFGYYLVGPSHESAIYLKNLDHLERQTERLSSTLTSETTAVIKKELVIQIRKRVQPIYMDCERKRSQLVGHIRHGLDNNIWQFVNAIK